MDDDADYHIEITGVGAWAPPGDTVRVATAPSWIATVRRAVEATLRYHHAGTAKVSVALVDDATIADLNRTHLNHEGPTDVLTFDLRDEVGPSGVIEGEIVLSVDTAAREAAARGHGVEVELALYAVHGVLHLLGCDDHTKPGAERMHAVESKILASIGLEIRPVDRG